MPNLALLYAVVFLSGGCVLAIEILGTRLLGPYYGVSLFLWSALITVTLAALSAGYAIGGRWADRGATMFRLASVLVVAGIWMLLVPWLNRPLLALTADMGLRTSVILAASILFGPPLLLLGIVSPYAIRLRAHSLQEVGRTAGNLYAVSTLASVFAALATGFWLIPNVGIQRLTIWIGVVLVGAGAMAALGGRGRGKASLAAVIVLGLGAAATLAPIRSAARSESIVFVGQSPYAQIRVMDRESVRYLLIDGGVHSSRGFADGASWHSYVPVLDLPREYFDRPGRMLLMGLGGGSVAQSYAAVGWTVDAVEIDPLVVEVARDYFGFTEEIADVHIMDGRRYLRETRHSYDVIVFDTFGSSSIPFHLITREVFALAKSRLTDDGVLAMNLEAIGWDHPFVGSVARTLRTSFRHVSALPVAEPPNALGNLIMLAMDRDDPDRPEASLEHPKDHLEDGMDHSRTIDRFHAWNNRFEPTQDRSMLLTDDRNPSDLWAEEINLVARRGLIDSFYREGEYGW